MAERDTLVEHETFAAPAALCLGHLFKIFKDAALEVVDVGKALREQIGTRLLAANAAGAEHRDSVMLRRIELLRDKILELPETRNAGIDRVGEGAYRHHERVSGVDQERIRRCDQRVPVRRLDIDSTLPRRIGAGITEGDDFL